MRALFLLSLIVAAAPALSQCVPRTQPRQHWDGVRLVEINVPQELGGGFTLDLLGPEPGIRRTITPEPGLSGLTVRDGVFYAVRMAPRGPQSSGPVLVSSLDGRTWELLAAFAPFETSGAGVYLYPVPLTRDLFLVKGDPLQPVLKEGVPFVLGTARIRKGLLEFESPLDLGIPKGATLPPFFSAQLRILPLGDRWLILHPPTGAAWLLTLSEEGQPRLKLLPLFEGVVPWARPKVPFEHVVLGFQPQQDGGVLLASRSEDGARLGRSDPDGKPLPDLSRMTVPRGETVTTALREAQGKRLQAQGEASLARYPQVWWWHLDPSGTRFERTPAPEGAPEALPTLQAFQQFGFTFDPQGRFCLTGESEKKPEPQGPPRLETR